MDDKPGVTVIQARPYLSETLEAVDSLRAAVEDGSARAFICVAIDDRDEVTMFSGASAPTSRLRMAGAASRLLHGVWDLEDD